MIVLEIFSAQELLLVKASEQSSIFGMTLRLSVELLSLVDM